MTNELLIAIPRAPRAPMLDADGKPMETISDIFREARAEAEASGRGPKKGGSRGGPGGGRGGPGGGSRGPRREGGHGSGPRREERPAAAAGEARQPRDPNAPDRQLRPPRDPNAPPRPPRDPNAPPRAEGEGARRRRGPRRDGAPGAEGGSNAARITTRLPVPPAAAPVVGVSKESFFKRMAAKVKSLVAPSKD